MEILATRKHMNVELRFKKIQSFVYGIRQHIGRKLVVICCLCHIEVDRWQLSGLKKERNFITILNKYQENYFELIS